MKLEMRVYNLDVKLELNDDDNFDALEILQGVKNLLDELSNFDDVTLSVMSVTAAADEETEDLYVEESSGWDFPETGLDSMGAVVEPIENNVGNIRTVV
jgi:hypothetical protein